jgi:DNA-binding MarR family transcriptional regulator
LLERLLQKDLVERTGSDTVRRCQFIRLTDNAGLLVPELAQLFDARS